MTLGGECVVAVQLHSATGLHSLQASGTPSTENQYLGNLAKGLFGMQNQAVSGRECEVYIPSQCHQGEADCEAPIKQTVVP